MPLAFARSSGGIGREGRAFCCCGAACCAAALLRGNPAAIEDAAPPRSTVRRESFAIAILPVLPRFSGLITGSLTWRRMHWNLGAANWVWPHLGAADGNFRLSVGRPDDADKKPRKAPRADRHLSEVRPDGPRLS